MSIIFRISLFILVFFLIVLGWLFVLLGFNVLPIGRISPFLDYRIAIFGFVLFGISLLVLSLEKRFFSSDAGIDIASENGSIRITKAAIEDLIKGIEINGIDELSCKVSIKDKMVDLRIFATGFSSSMERIGDSINKEIDNLMQEIMIKDYRKMVYINHIKRRRRLV
ncbi:MAG: hypothetical protein AB1297_01575 [bacterium]